MDCPIAAGGSAGRLIALVGVGPVGEGCAREDQKAEVSAQSEDGREPGQKITHIATAAGAGKSVDIHVPISSTHPKRPPLTS